MANYHVQAVQEVRVGVPAAFLLRAVLTRGRGLCGATTRKAGWALLAQAIVSGSNFLTTVMIGRYCGMHELGIYSLAFAMLVAAAVIHESLLWSPYTVYSRRLRPEERSAYAGSVLVLQVLFSGIGMLLLAAFASVMTSPDGVETVLWVFVGTLPFYLWRQFVRRLLLAQLEVTRVVAIDFVVMALQFGGFLLLLEAHCFTAASACAVVGVACALPSVTWLRRTPMAFQFRANQLRGELRRHWSFGRWICASQLTDVTQKYALHWLLATVMGTAATGAYAAAVSVVIIFNPLLLGIGSVLVPKAAQSLQEGGRAEVQRVVGKTTVFLVGMMLVLGVLLVVIGDDAVRLLYRGGPGVGQWEVIVLLVLTALAGTAGFAADAGLWVLERPDINFRASVTGLAVTLVVASALVGSWGVPGAALGGLLGAVLASGLKGWAFVRLSRDQCRAAGPQPKRCCRTGQELATNCSKPAHNRVGENDGSARLRER
jgi:O-antigen/teichoic acid export membrane protein